MVYVISWVYNSHAVWISYQQLNCGGKAWEILDKYTNHITKSTHPYVYMVVKCVLLVGLNPVCGEVHKFKKFLT